MPGISKTVISLKPGTMEDVTKFLDEKAGEINQTPGGLGFAVAVTGEDEITLIGLFEASQNARDQVNTSRQYSLKWLLSWPLHRIGKSSQEHGSQLNSLIIEP